jgi:hypothetical protein
MLEWMPLSVFLVLTFFSFHFNSSDVAGAAKEMINELQFTLQKELALDRLQVLAGTEEVDCTAEVQEFAKSATAVGGRETTSLFEMFTQGLMCCSAPTE